MRSIRTINKRAIVGEPAKCFEELRLTNILQIIYSYVFVFQVHNQYSLVPLATLGLNCFRMSPPSQKTKLRRLDTVVLRSPSDTDIRTLPPRLPLAPGSRLLLHTPCDPEVKHVTTELIYNMKNHMYLSGYRLV